ncbi:hypothetical protein PRNP1_000116 [Phytophthora ramorum]
MEVVALNERLRGVFSALLKVLPPPYAVSTLSTTKSSVSSSSAPDSAPSSDRYTQHCRFMLWRLNSYQYGTASAFLLDLEQLVRAAEAPERKKQVQNLLDQLAVSEGEKQGQENALKTYTSGGGTVLLSACCGVPGLQEVAAVGSEGEETENKTVWLCNVSLKDHIVTIGTFKTQEEALAGYEEQREKMADSTAGFTKLRQLADKVEAEQRAEDERVLNEAVVQCHPRLTSLKASALAASAASANSSVLNASGAGRAIPRSVARSIAAAASSSPAASPAPSEAGASPLRVSRASKRQKAESSSAATAPAKRQRVESVGNSGASTASSSAGRSYLKLRRLIQKRLCRHLKGKEVCVLSSPEKLDEARLRASGRLEAGKVFSFRRKKQLTFANYVQDELGRAESACAHMFLVRTKECIDDHLKVCDAFSDRERELEPSRHPQPAKSRRRAR